MKIILLILIYITLFFTASSTALAMQTANYDKAKTKPKSGSVWKLEINYPPFSNKSGLKSQIFFLILYLDGTYEQQVFLIPEDKETYKGIRYYQLSGKWTSNDKEVVLDENGKIERIENSVFYSKFENVDNIIVNSR